ncbi:hypothetical protein J6590_083860 [Homalodisca vitripennis]|nr:hypothetical protein J6590_083860 [Homalodisca vitripennis]
MVTFLEGDTVTMGPSRVTEFALKTDKVRHTTDTDCGLPGLSSRFVLTWNNGIDERGAIVDRMVVAHVSEDN